MPPTVTTQLTSASGLTAQPNDTFILVIGQIGAGKSTFINSVVGREVASVNDGYIEGSHTKKIAPFVVDGHVNSRSSGRIVLVDTPGFNDVTAGDVGNVQRISNFLATCPPTALASIIYIYEMTQDRSPSNNNFMSPSRFAHLSASRNVLLTTVKWSEVHAIKGEERQEQIQAEWGHIYDDGARIVRYEDSCESALEIVKRICLYTTTVESLRRDMMKVFGAAGDSRPSSRTGSRTTFKDPGCFANLFRSRSAY